MKEEEHRKKRDKTPKRSEGLHEPPPVLAAKGEKGGKGYKGHPENYERGYKETPKGGKGNKGEERSIYSPLLLVSPLDVSKT